MTSKSSKLVLSDDHFINICSTASPKFMDRRFKQTQQNVPIDNTFLKQAVSFPLGYLRITLYIWFAII